jgi:aryl-alcohol dehydrogenase-like predicted oxidoreductase
MQLAGPCAFGTPPDRASAIGVLQAAVAAGVDHIDTAQYYAPGVVNGHGLADLPVSPYGQGDEYGQQAADPCRGGSQ